MDDNAYTFYWKDGNREVLRGVTVEAAFSGGGYGNGALRALDFFVYGTRDDYVWCKEKHRWKRIAPQIQSIQGE